MNIKPKKSKDLFEYLCPHCKRILAVGILKSLYVRCADCNQWANYNQQDDEVVKSAPNTGTPINEKAIKKIVGGELYRKAYGRDRITIEEMTTNPTDCKNAGHSHYFSGKPCRHGHIAPRTRRGDCNECNRLYAQKTKQNKQKQGK